MSYALIFFWTVYSSNYSMSMSVPGFATTEDCNRAGAEVRARFQARKSKYTENYDWVCLPIPEKKP